MTTASTTVTDTSGEKKECNKVEKTGRRDMTENKIPYFVMRHQRQWKAKTWEGYLDERVKNKTTNQPQKSVYDLGTAFVISLSAFFEYIYYVVGSWLLSHTLSMSFLPHALVWWAKRKNVLLRIWCIVEKKIVIRKWRRAWALLKCMPLWNKAIASSHFFTISSFSFYAFFHHLFSVGISSIV